MMRDSGAALKHDLTLFVKSRTMRGAELPRRELVFYREADGSVPLVEWLRGLSEKAREECLGRLEWLEEMGHALRRPAAENLGGGIYELRVKHRGVNYRMLYFFHGTSVVVAAQGFVKQQAVVPLGEIRKAAERMRVFQGDPRAHSFKGSV